jgi:putative redox protein
MDAKKPIGRDTAMTPKELVVAGLCGCTAMDVVAYLRKSKCPAATLEVTADVETSKGGHPTVFERVTLQFRVTGDVDPVKLEEAVHLSQTEYCGVSAMLTKGRAPAPRAGSPRTPSS